MEKSQLLDEADKLDVQASIACKEALSLRHEYLRFKGWEIDGEMIGPSMTYFYRKGDYVGTDELSALEHEEFECINGE